MAEKNLAFETGEVSVLFYSIGGLGDVVVARKVFDAVIELAPNCRVDIFCAWESHKNFARAFFGDSPNLNLILDDFAQYEQILTNYDLSLWTLGTHAVHCKYVNIRRLQSSAPALLETFLKIIDYNNENLYEFSQEIGRASCRERV